MDLLSGDEPLAEQKLDVAVVTAACDHGSLSEMIDATVADVSPPGRTLLHETGRARRARTLLHRQAGAELHDFLVRTPERHVQEAQWVEQGLWDLPECVENDLLRHLGSLRAMRMPTHPVRNNQEGSMFGDCRGDPILVLFAAAQKADLGVLDPQGEIRVSVRLSAALYHPSAAERSFSCWLEVGGSIRPNRFDRLEERLSTIASMTGFARREISGPWGTLVCELRSVNHRFLEAGFRLPDELRAAEPELRQRLARAVRRGKVDCSISYRRSQGSESALEVDAQALERLLARVRDVARAVPEKHTVNVLDVLRWPGVLRDDTSVGEELLKAAHTLFSSTLDELVAARGREGARLREILEQRCAALETLVSQVRARLPEVHTRVRSRLDERMSELQINVDRDRLEQELALLLQRLDVDEELERLAGHIIETRRVINGNEPAGRRLDFLMQELNREANTLSSKSQDLETTRSAVDMKVIIEQMREQVQNLE